MDALIIEESFRTPKVELDPSAGKFVFSGRSLPEDPNEFYDPVIKWMEKYIQNPTANAEFEFRIGHRSYHKMIRTQGIPGIPDKYRY